MAIISPQKAAAPPPTLKLNTGRGKIIHPLWITLYSTEGLGKSTFASRAPSPVFIDAERGTRELDVDRIHFDEEGRTTPASFTEILLALRALENDPHSYKTVVIDTLDAVEALIWSHCCDRDGKAGIEDYGYGKGYVVAIDQWRVLMSYFERLRDRRGMNIITLAHSAIKTFKDPASDGWDRYQMKLHQAAAGLIKEKSDIVLYGAYETLTAKNDKTKRTQGVSTGKRIIHTVHNAAWDAKNRHGLPEEMGLRGKEFWEALKSTEKESTDV